MPQLDKFSFSSQIIWVLIIFFGLYFIVVKFLLPILASTFKYRQKLLESLYTFNIKISSFNYSSHDKYLNEIIGMFKDIGLIINYINILLVNSNNYINSLVKNRINFNLKINKKYEK